MARSVLKELLEARDEILGRTHPDEPWYNRLEHGYKEMVDVVGAVISATDDENRATDLLQLQADISTVARSTADLLLSKNPWLLGVAQGVITAAVAGTNQLIAKHTEDWDEWVTANILPPLRKIRDLLEHTLVQLEGDAHDDPDHIH